MRRPIIAPLLALALGACSAAGDFVGSPHAYIGEIETPIGLNVDGVPTIAPDGTSPMGFRRNADGSVEGAYNTVRTPEITITGIAAIVWTCGADQDCIVAALGL